TGLLWVLAPSWSRLLTGDSAHADLVRIVAVTLYTDALALVPLTLIRMEQRSVAFVTITLIRFGASFGLNILFITSFGWGVRGILLANAITSVGVLLLLIPEYRRRAGQRPSWALLKRMLAFGVPMFPLALSSWLIDASDRYIISVFRSRQEVGYYALAYRIAQAMQIAVVA